MFFVTVKLLSMLTTPSSSYVSNKDFNMIEKQLSEDMEAIDKWCRDNEFILNLKKGKTEAIMFGTKQMLLKHKDELKVSYQNKPVSTCVTYKYPWCGPWCKG